MDLIDRDSSKSDQQKKAEKALMTLKGHDEICAINCSLKMQTNPSVEVCRGGSKGSMDKRKKKSIQQTWTLQ